MNNTEYLKEEFKKAVLDVRPDSIITDSCRDGVSVAKPNASYNGRYIAWLDIDKEAEGMYQVWNGLDWDKYHTLEQFKSNFIGRYGCTTKPKEAHEDKLTAGLDDVYDTRNYHGVKGTYEPINVMEYAHEQYLKRGLGADEALNLAIAIKYLLRVGTKDDKLQEMFKAEDFIHRARTEEWIEREH